MPPGYFPPNNLVVNNHPGDKNKKNKSLGGYKGGYQKKIKEILRYQWVKHLKHGQKETGQEQEEIIKQLELIKSIIKIIEQKQKTGDDSINNPDNPNNPDEKSKGSGGLKKILASVAIGICLTFLSGCGDKSGSGNNITEISIDVMKQNLLPPAVMLNLNNGTISINEEYEKMGDTNALKAINIIYKEILGEYDINVFLEEARKEQELREVIQDFYDFLKNLKLEEQNEQNKFAIEARKRPFRAEMLGQATTGFLKDEMDSTYLSYPYRGNFFEKLKQNRSLFGKLKRINDKILEEEKRRNDSLDYIIKKNQEIANENRKIVKKNQEEIEEGKKEIIKRLEEMGYTNVKIQITEVRNSVRRVIVTGYKDGKFEVIIDRQE